MSALLLAGRWLLANPITALLLATCTALGTGLGWAHGVTIPLLEHQAAVAQSNEAKATSALAGANAATAECNSSEEVLRAQVEQQNQQIDALTARATAAEQRADAAGAAAAVNAYLQSLRSQQ